MKKTKTKFTSRLDKFDHLLDSGWYEYNSGIMGFDDCKKLLDLEEFWIVDDDITEPDLYDEYDDLIED